MPERHRIPEGNWIGGREVPGGGQAVVVINPRTGESLSGEFRDATEKQVDEAVRLAQASIATLVNRRRRSELLRQIAASLRDASDRLVLVAAQETGLPTERLVGEVERAAKQFDEFANVVSQGNYLELYLDEPDTSGFRLRRMLHPLGPVAVFGASNFPFAFSVAGGDTASALAAGCPVIAKAHPAHPGTSGLSAEVIARVMAAVGVHPGAFSLIHGTDHEVGLHLVRHPGCRAVAFTGSQRGGRAIFDAAVSRRIPIPVYAEMGSTNPVFVTAAAMRRRGEAIAEDLARAITLGTGQFCTKPGLIVVPDTPEGDRFTGQLTDAVARIDAQPMLTDGIRQTLATSIKGVLSQAPDVDVLVPLEDDNRDGCWQSPALYSTDLATFSRHSTLREERFGPVAFVIRSTEDEYCSIPPILEGLLVACVYCEEADLEWASPLVASLEGVAGRIVFNDVPTGVAVVPGMQHGGPYPAATWPLFTSVGHTAIRRFLRPVSYQGAPEALLPEELRQPQSPPLRIIDGAPHLPNG